MKTPMTQFVVRDREGFILRTGTCQAPDLAAQADKTKREVASEATAEDLAEHREDLAILQINLREAFGVQARATSAD